MAYGAFSVVGKIARTPVYRAGPSGLYNPLFATSDARAPLAELTATFNPQSDVWYLTEAFTAMDLPGRAILQHADFLPVDALKRTFRTSKPMRVHLLLPPWFEQNGKGAAIRGEFLGAGNWSSRTVSGMNYVEWTATLTAVSNWSTHPGSISGSWRSPFILNPLFLVRGCSHLLSWYPLTGRKVFERRDLQVKYSAIRTYLPRLSHRPIQLA